MINGGAPTTQTFSTGNKPQIAKEKCQMQERTLRLGRLGPCCFMLHDAACCPVYLSEPRKKTKEREIDGVGIHQKAKIYTHARRGARDMDPLRSEVAESKKNEEYRKKNTHKAINSNRS